MAKKEYFSPKIGFSCFDINVLSVSPNPDKNGIEWDESWEEKE